jgi:stage V sporulation protein E
LIVIGVFLYIIIEAVKISLHVDNNYLKFLSLGIGLSLFTQVFINIGVVIGLLPVTGITLPILSYGGSSLVLTLMFLGLIINISQYTEEVK